jgi:hypothetical protein
MLYYVISCHIMSYHVISCHIMSYHVISCHIMSYHVISCHIKSYHVISCHIISYHVISCHILLFQVSLDFSDHLLKSSDGREGGSNMGNSAVRDKEKNRWDRRSLCCVKQVVQNGGHPYSGTGWLQKSEISAEFLSVYCDRTVMYKNVLSHSFPPKMLRFGVNGLYTSWGQSNVNNVLQYVIATKRAQSRFYISAVGVCQESSAAKAGQVI